MTIQEAEKWKSIAQLYEKTFALYVSLRGKIQDNEFPVIDNIAKEALSSGELSEYFSTNLQNKDKVFKSDNIQEHVYQIQENIEEVWKKVDKTTDIYMEMKMDAYKTAGEMYEEIGDLQNAAEMYSYSYDYCLDKSVELYEKIAKEQK
jgi:transcriptional regulator of heat shock response